MENTSITRKEALLLSAGIGIGIGLTSMYYYVHTQPTIDKQSSDIKHLQEQIKHMSTVQTEEIMRLNQTREWCLDNQSELRIVQKTRSTYLLDKQLTRLERYVKNNISDSEDFWTPYSSSSSSN